MIPAKRRVAVGWTAARQAKEAGHFDKLAEIRANERFAPKPKAVPKPKVVKPKADKPVEPSSDNQPVGVAAQQPLTSTPYCSKEAVVAAKLLVHQMMETNKRRLVRDDVVLSHAVYGGVDHRGGTTNSFEQYACHASAPRCCRGAVILANAVWGWDRFGMQDYARPPGYDFAGYGVHRTVSPKLAEHRDVQKRFMFWLMHQSPYHACFLKVAPEENMLLVRTDLPSDYAHGALSHYRRMTEQVRAVLLWDKMVKEGVHPNIAFPLAVLSVERNGDLTLSTTMPYHSIFQATLWGEEQFANYVRGCPKFTKNKTYNTGCGYFGVDLVFGTVPEYGHGYVKKLQKEFFSAKGTDAWGGAVTKYVPFSEYVEMALKVQERIFSKYGPPDPDETYKILKVKPDYTEY